jgi:Arc/MetJ-type ribon-helix-helix transcriptional regulator
MNIRISPILNQQIQESVQRGDFASTDDLVNTALSKFIQNNNEQRTELTRAIDEGIKDLENGNYIEYDEQSITKLSKDIHERGLRRLRS